MHKKTIHIGFISSGYGNSPVISGGETRLYNIIKRLPGDFDATLITTQAGAAVASQNIGRYPLRIITVAASLFLRREIFRFSRLWSYLISGIHAINKMHNLELDIVYSSSDALCDTYPASVYRKRPGVKWVAMIHHMYLSPSKRPGNYLINFLLYSLQTYSLRLIASRADMVFVLDTDAGREIEKRLVRMGYKGKFHRVLNGITTPVAKPAKKDKNLAIYIGGLRPSKGIYDIVPVWKKVVEKIPSLKLHVIGKGDRKYMNYITLEIKKNGLENNVLIRGYLNDGEIRRLLSRAFIFALPSHEEGWCISAAEAIANRCHTILYSLPAFKVFDGHVHKVPCFDTTAFAKKIISIYRHAKVPPVPVGFINKFRWDNLAKNEVKILRKLTVK